MITAAEAQKLTESTLNEVSKQWLLDDLDKRIRAVAANGQAYLKLDGMTDAQNNFLRAVLTQHGFQLSDVGLTIYW